MNNQERSDIKKYQKKSVKIFDNYCRICIKKILDMLNLNRKDIGMLKMNFEFRKGIFFIRLIGSMNSKNSKIYEKEIKNLLMKNQFKYIVINIDNLKSIDLNGINYLSNIYNMTKKNHHYLVLCDKFKLLNNIIPSIDSELEVL